MAATAIIVLGRGLDVSRQALTPEGVAGVERLLDHLDRHRERYARSRATVVFSGGWPGATQGVGPPARTRREGRLMLELATASGGERLAGLATCFAEDESDSTLENFLRTRAGDFFPARGVDARNPLGIVTGRQHMRRAAFVARKVFGEDVAVERIVVPERPGAAATAREAALYVLYRLVLVGRGTSPTALRRRERRLVAVVATARRLRRRRRGEVLP